MLLLPAVNRAALVSTDATPGTSDSTFHNLACVHTGRNRFNLFQISFSANTADALRSITKKKLNVPEKPKLKCLGFTYIQCSKVIQYAVN